MTSRTPDVSVVVLTKNSRRTVEMCLESVLAQKPGEVLDVDSHSTDGTLNILRHYGVMILADDVGSLGFSRQLGVQTAKGRFVMFVDSDVELGPHCISTLQSDIERYGWVGIHARLLSRENMSYWQKAEDEKFQGAYRRTESVNQIGTIAAMFRRDVLLKFPFDPSFSKSAEDVDLCRRLVRAGYHLGVSGAVAYHNHRREFTAFVRQKYRNGLGAARLSPLKYGRLSIFDPLVSILSQTIRSLATRKIWLVPYFFVSGVARFVGVIVGLSRQCNSHVVSKADV
jgi:GT2 family glycosyltransferase